MKAIFTITLLFFSFSAFTDDFVTTWKTDNWGLSNNTTIRVPMIGGPYDVDWDNDGTFDEFGISGTGLHHYPVAGIYTIRIRGTYDSIRFNNDIDEKKIISLDQWGTNPWKSMNAAFHGALNMQVLATDTPDFSAVTDMSDMFSSAALANPDTSGWDTSAVTDMQGMFSSAESANPDTSGWDTSSVTDMSRMFRSARSANPDTSNWDTSSVTDMSEMFEHTHSANPDTSGWDTSAVTNLRGMFKNTSVANPDTSDWDTSAVSHMSGMFLYARSANPDTSGWDTSAVSQMSGMFLYAISANPDTSDWDTSSVTDMSEMFSGAHSANPDTSGWDTSAVTNMRGMFKNTTSANPDTNGWGTSAVTVMSSMFEGATSANPDTSNWDTSAVTSMSSMFEGATSANPDTSNWDTSAVTDMSSMFNGATAANPDTSNWDTSAIIDMIYMFAGATSANPDTSRWDTSVVIRMRSMFHGAIAANPDTKGWDTSAVTTMRSMFHAATTANPDTSGWDTSAVVDLMRMFKRATSANPDTGDWDTSAVTEMSSMFEHATSANPDISAWDTSAVTDVNHMFAYATSFNRDPGAWDVTKIEYAFDMFEGVTLSKANYESLLIGWSVQDLNTGVHFGGGKSTYCSAAAVAAKEEMVAKFAWVIIDGGQVCPPDQPTGIRATDGDYANFVRVTFNWVNRATVYRIYRCLENGSTCGSPIGYTKSLTFDDSKGVSEKVYYYRVRACIENTCSKFSVADTGFTTAAPDQPTGIRATDGTFADRVQLTFNMVDKATVYRVFRCTDSGNTCGPPIGYPKTETFDDRKGESGTVYYYRVRACTTNICGKFSVANAGHRSSIPAAENDKNMVIVNGVANGTLNDVPIPSMNDAGRWFLILMTMGIGLLLIHREQVQRREPVGAASHDFL